MVSHRSREAGFTIVEVLVVVAVLAILGGSSMLLMASTLPSYRADSQARRLIGVLQHARELSIATRRDIEVRINEANDTISLFRRDAGVEILFETFAFEYGVQFMQFHGAGDTPEGFGANGAVDFGNSTVLLFDAEGSLIDETGLPANGTMYTGVPEVASSARAIAVIGTTGRPRLYRWQSDGQGGGTWLQ